MRMLELEVFVVERIASKDARAAGTISIDEVTTLDHEVRDNSVESAALVSATVGFASAELPEVL